MLYSAETPIEDVSQDTPEEINEWLMMARDAFEQAEDYFDGGIRPKQETALAHFNNQHAPGSKYYSDSYKYRAKGFRPKSRSVVRKNEAAAAKAFFSTQDVVHVQAENDNDEAQQVSAQINHELINYRLENTIPWFQTCLGAYQDTLVNGVCISHQTWTYTEELQETPDLDETGSPIYNEMGLPGVQTQSKTVKDEPTIELRPIENVMFAPSSDWTDPIGTSPYIIDRIPMFVGDIKVKMVTGEWKELDDGQIRISSDSDTLRSSREKNRDDSQDMAYATSEFETSWVHRNIIRKGDIDYIFYTLGTYHLLSEPTPLLEVYTHLGTGERPYVLGYSILETHKTYPSSLVSLTEGLQQEANDINNQRRDNVSLVLNKRYYVRRGSGIDFKSLTRNIPGSVTLMDDINADIRTESPPEVTGSSYQEQDRVNMDYDELSGSFSTSSVSSNRNLNETVGGMNMLQGDANEMIEYQIRMFAETWVEPVLKQLVQLEQAFEDDQTILNLMGEQVDLYQRYNVDQVTNEMLQGKMTVRVNVGFGATNPQKRIEKLTMGLNTIGQFMPHVIQGIDPKEVIGEVMGALGFRDGSRFFPQLNEDQQDPQAAQMQQQIQQLQQQLQSKQMEIDGRIKVAQINADGRMQAENLRAQSEMQQEAIRNEGKAMEAQIDAQIEQTKLAYQKEIDMMDRQIQFAKSEIERGKLINQRDSLIWQMRKETEDLLDNRVQNDKPEPNPDNRLSQVIMNDRYGNIPGMAG